MPPPNSHTAAASASGINLRMRPELSVRPQWYGGRRYWAVKDPITLRYFLLREEEWTILRMLDGRTGLAQIKRHYEQRFRPRRISNGRLQSFIAHAHRDGLVTSDASGQADQLLRRRQHKTWRSIMGTWTNPLALRLRGIDPDRFLTWLAPRCGWLFSPWFVAICTVLALSAATLVLVQFDVLQKRWPDFYTLFKARNLLGLAVVLACVKVLHELGHGLACKHFGGHCHEMGVLFLVFVPCLYCNVSDSWMMPNKWHRVAIAGAGIYVEIMLASVAAFLWWFSEPGMVNAVCRNTIFVCSIGTVLFNGNPLLRFDGYYVLSDLIEVPNLWQRSRAVVSETLARWCLGLEIRSARTLPESRKFLLAGYAVVSICYRWIVLVAILWFLYEVLRLYDLQIFVPLLVVSLLTGVIMPTAVSTIGFMQDPLNRQRWNWGRAALSGGVVFALLAFLWMLPLPCRVRAPVVTEAKDAQVVYISVPGTLTEAVRVGQPITKGQTLGTLENRDIRMDVVKLAGQCDQQRSQLANLESRRVYDPDAGGQIPAAREALTDLERRLEQLEQDERRLTLIAPTDGTVLPVPRRAAPSDSPGRLPTWHGLPLDEHNRRSFLEVGTPFCAIGNPARLEAVLVIDQADVDFVRSGQRLRIELDAFRGTVLSGKIVDIAKISLKVTPRQLSTDPDLASRVASGRMSGPEETLYQARVSLHEHDLPLLIGMRGRAKIVVDPQSLGRRLSRFLHRTFRFL